MSSTEDKIKVMQAYVDRETIQVRSDDGRPWEDWECQDMSPAWDWRGFQYRIKPKPREWIVCCLKDGRIQSSCGPLDTCKLGGAFGDEVIRVREVLE